MADTGASCVFPSDSVSNTSSDVVTSPFELASSILASLGSAPSGMAGLHELVSSASSYERSGDVIGRYMDHQDELLRVYAAGMDSVSRLVGSGQVAGGLQSSGVVGGRSSFGRKQTSFPGYSPPLTYEQMQQLHATVGTRHFSVAFESLHRKYSRGYEDGTSFSVHRFGSMGSSVASSNFGSFGPGRCYLMLIAGGHKSAAREMFRVNPDFTSLLSAPAHMFSVSALLSVKFTKLDFLTAHAGVEGTYTAISVFARFIQQQSFHWTLTSSVWDGTLLQAIVCRGDFADIALRCTETLPYQLKLGGRSPDSLGIDDGPLGESQLAAMSDLASSLFPSRDWKFVQCLGGGSDVVTVERVGVLVDVVYGSDFSFVAMSPTGSGRFWFPLHASERPSAALRDLVESARPSRPVPSADLLALSQQDFSTCRCAIHVWPRAVEEYRLSCVVDDRVVGPARAAFEGQHHFCAADEVTRQADKEFLRIVVGGVQTRAFESVTVDPSLKRFASANSMSSSEFGPGYCYLDAIRGRYRYRVARLLGPCAFAVDIDVMHRAVGRVDTHGFFDPTPFSGVGHFRRCSPGVSSGGSRVHARLASLVRSHGSGYRVGASSSRPTLSRAERANFESECVRLSISLLGLLSGGVQSRSDVDRYASLLTRVVNMKRVAPPDYRGFGNLWDNAESYLETVFDTTRAQVVEFYFEFGGSSVVVRNSCLELLRSMYPGYSELLRGNSVVYTAPDTSFQYFTSRQLSAGLQLHAAYDVRGIESLKYARWVLSPRGT